MIGRLHKPFFYIVVALVCATAALIIAKIWGIELPDDLFFKVMATLAVLILLFGFLLVVNSDFGEHKKLKDDNYLD
ncbi:MAG: hypothetical protein AAF204_03075 [Pseudomonadota bacterium]